MTSRAVRLLAWLLTPVALFFDWRDRQRAKAAHFIVSPECDDRDDVIEWLFDHGATKASVWQAPGGTWRGTGVVR